MARPSFIYRLTVSLAGKVAPLAARFDKKLARSLDARRGLVERLQTWVQAHRDPKRPLVWVHAPSVGEGLQAKPVLEALRVAEPQWQLAYTFFSPSAERLAKSLPVDVTDYLPFDRPRDVRAVLRGLEPTALVFSKLDVWPELTLAAARAGVRLGLISATVAPTSSRLRWPTRQWAAPAYRALHRIGAISVEDGQRLQKLGARPEAIEVTGDTRYDSVAERAERFDRTREPFSRVATGDVTFTIVAGSTWPADEAVVLPASRSAPKPSVCRGRCGCRSSSTRLRDPSWWWTESACSPTSTPWRTWRSWAAAFIGPAYTRSSSPPCSVSP